VKKTCNSCASQAIRLSAKPFWASMEPEAQLELANTIHRFGHAIAEIVVDEALIRRWEYAGRDAMPSPADLWDLCLELKAGQREPLKVAAITCQHCDGSGWEIVVRNGNEGVVKCRCGGVPPAHISTQSFEARPARQDSELKRAKVAV
jgi:hypothetical protein